MTLLDQKWPLKKEFIPLSNIKISKNHNVKSATFQIHSNKDCSKIINTLFAI
jgi:hypothetical protein